MPKKKHVGKHRPKNTDISIKENKTTPAKKIKMAIKKPATTKTQIKPKKPVNKQKVDPDTSKKKAAAAPRVPLWRKLTDWNYLQSKSAYIAVGVLVIFVSITAVYGYKGYRQAQVDNYKSAIYSIGVNSTESITNANNLYASFTDSLIVDDSAVNNFKDVTDISKRALMAIDTLAPPKRFQKTHNRMLNLYKIASRTYAGLEAFCSYVVKRNQKLASVGESANAYSAKVKEARRRVEAVDLANTATSRLTSVYNQLAKIQKGKNVYKDSLLSKYMATLKGQLDELQVAVNNRSRYKIKGALDVIAEDYNQKWSKAFVTTDDKFMARFKPSVSKIQVLNSQISY